MKIRDITCFRDLAEDLVRGTVAVSGPHLILVVESGENRLLLAVN